MAHDLENGRWVARFRAAGAGRFFQAGFLIVWLCGWAVGETFALGSLIAIGLSHLPAGWASIPAIPFKADAAFSVAAVLFLVVWVTFWTLGGIMAARETLRLLWSSDEIQWDGGGLVLVRRIGPFTSRREIPADQILGFRETPPHRSLTVALERGGIEITRLGTPVERRELKAALRAAIPSRRPLAPATELPAGWCTAIGSGGMHVLTTTPDRVRLRAIIAWIIGGALVVTGGSILAAGIGSDATAGETWLRLLGVIPILGGAPLIAFFGLGTSEIRVRPGSVEFVRRVLRHEWSREITVGVIRITHDRDSDGDSRYTLLIHGDGRRKTVASALHDPAELLALGRWLEARIQRPLELDREVPADE